jgi:hypothetical protein
LGVRVADRLTSEDGGLMESQGDVGCVVCCVQRNVHVEERERERRRGLPQVQQTQRTEQLIDSVHMAYAQMGIT